MHRVRTDAGLTQAELAAGLVDNAVAVEYRLPLTSKRLDVLITGDSPAGKDPAAVIVELKQWDEVGDLTWTSA